MLEVKWNKIPQSQEITPPLSRAQVGGGILPNEAINRFPIIE
jgi:hypothetical protein